MPLKGLGNVKQEIRKVRKDLNDNVRAVWFTGLTSMVLESPVDEGETRNNFFLTVDKPSAATRGKSKAGNGSLRSVKRLHKKVLGKTFYFANNKPQAHVLEFGGYPTPVKQGTWNKKTKSYEIRSIKGFSKQAPKGWIRAVVIRMQNAIRKL